jgi:hypothetical protein
LHTRFVNLSSGSKLLAGLALVAVASTGCASTNSGKTNTSADATASPTAPASSGSASSGPAGSSPSATMPSDTGTASSVTPSGGMAGPAGCRTRDLRVTLSAGDGAAGSTFYSVRLRNVSMHPCRTGGFGGVSLVRAPHGAPVGAPADRVKKSSAKPLTLRPGARAEATLQVTSAENYPAGKCQPTQAKGFRVYPPNETRSAFVAQPTPACRSAKVHLLSLAPYRLVG